MSSTSVADQTSDARGYRLLLLALLITALAYLATLRFGFVYDDEPQIVLNPTLTTWSSLATFFTAHSWKFLLPDWAGNYYRPVFMTWLVLNRMAFGENTVMWHATTVLVHLVSTFMAFVVSRQVLRDGTRAGFVALLFGLHPVHIESVAWISGVTDPLMAVFVLAAFWAWIRGERNVEQRGLWQLAAVIFYAAGCLTKESALFLPAIIVAYDVLFGRDERSWKGIVHSAMQVWPLWLTAAGYMVARKLALRGLVHPVDVPLAYNLLTIPTILWGYMRRLVWPVHMSVFYDTPPVTSVLQWRFWLPMLAWILVGILMWRIAKRSRTFALSLIWIFVFLLPAIIGLPAFSIGEWIHDRYLYLPSFGFCMLIVHVVGLLPSKREIFGNAAVPATVVFVLSAAMAFTTSWEEQYWANGLLLFAHGAKVAPNSALNLVHLANEVLRRGNREDTDRLYRKALAIEPNNWKNNLSYGLMLYYTDRFAEADQQLARSIALQPWDSNQYFYQGMSRFNLGDFAGAEKDFEQAVMKGPLRPRYHFWLGFSLEKQNRMGEARQQFEEELKEHPDTDTPAQQHLENLK